MNREIKFRGKRIDNGKWAYGYFVKTPITTEFNCDGQFLDSGAGRYCIIENGVAHEIDIETLGQDTGLKDKNGKEIYEGDVVDWDGDKMVVEYGIQSVDAFEGIGFNLWSFYDKHEDIGKAIRLQSEIEIIGDIYSNPELLSN